MKGKGKLFLSCVGLGLVTYIPIIVLILIFLCPQSDFGFGLKECLQNVLGCLFYLVLTTTVHLFANYPVIVFLISIFLLCLLSMSVHFLYKKEYILINLITLLISGVVLILLIILSLMRSGIIK